VGLVGVARLVGEPRQIVGARIQTGEEAAEPQHALNKGTALF
jgi:hypothetical protein